MSVVKDKLERHKRLELFPSAWKAVMLPINTNAASVYQLCSSIRSRAVFSHSNQS